MPVTPNQTEAISKKELIKKMSIETGFTQSNCKIAYDALIKIFEDTLLEGRSIVFKEFGRLEPYMKSPRKFYKINRVEGIAKDAAGRKITFSYPETRWVKFHMAQSFKFKMNPGLYINEEVNVDDSD